MQKRGRESNIKTGVAGKKKRGKIVRRAGLL